MFLAVPCSMMRSSGNDWTRVASLESSRGEPWEWQRARGEPSSKLVRVASLEPTGCYSCVRSYRYTTGIIGFMTYVKMMFLAVPCSMMRSSGNDWTRVASLESSRGEPWEWQRARGEPSSKLVRVASLEPTGCYSCVRSYRYTTGIIGL